MAKVITVKVKSKHEIMGRGTVWAIDLKENNISCERKQWIGAGIYLKGFVQEQNGDTSVYQIQGIEAFATNEGYCHENIGLLVKKLNNYNGQP